MWSIADDEMQMVSLDYESNFWSEQTWRRPFSRPRTAQFDRPPACRTEKFDVWKIYFMIWRDFFGIPIKNDGVGISLCKFR